MAYSIAEELEETCRAIIRAIGNREQREYPPWMLAKLNDVLVYFEEANDD